MKLWANTCKIIANNINSEENLILNNELDTNNKVNTTINNDKRIYSINKSVYILGPGDQINIKFVGVPEISGTFDIFSDGNIHLLDNFKKLTHWGNKRLKNKSIFKQDKGQINCVRKFLEALKRNQDSPIDFEDLIEIQQWLITALKFH